MITTLYRYRGRIITIFFIVVLLVGWFLYDQNNTIETTELVIEAETLPDELEGYRIVQLSDLHNKQFGRDQQPLVGKVKDAQPDVIVFTGDIIDSRRYQAAPAIELIEKLTDVATVYYVTGNHEWHSGNYDELEPQLVEAGAIVINDAAVSLESSGASINLLGIADPDFSPGMAEDKAIEASIEAAFEDTSEEQVFTILLSHRPEWFSVYTEWPIDLVFTGHAHGGQVRLPFIGGLVAPGQGFFPDYTSGSYHYNETTMIVNRGLGNSVIPQRLFNRPEMTVVTLSKTTESPQS
ncbi:metallophosphoesterase [Alkalicoccobacillus murimartini]|uniref:MPP superfamily phosphohydrolase n=1 Tax=Alkalicoccobacillus murimartini TaxID=171685 RepID=A0ABT9YEK2_9BACI|nr:metallophosphoesterase [Alkalicoccobacillus murimartini]MDQ0206154.1 putative MPP superfamily phosphohydrolase [Alkalicoccobacillus murimartini]